MSWQPQNSLVVFSSVSCCVKLSKLIPRLAAEISSVPNETTNVYKTIYTPREPTVRPGHPHCWFHHSLVSSPDPPSTVQEERGSGEYSTTFLYLRGISAVQSDWLMLAIISPVLGRLPYHKPLIFSHHTLAHPPIYWSPVKDFKDLAFSESIATASS